MALPGGPDALFSVRNNFYLGAYQAAVYAAGETEGLLGGQEEEKDCLVYRAYIALGQANLVLQEVPESDGPRSLRAVRLLARYETEPGSHQEVRDQLAALLEEEEHNEEPLGAVVGATMLSKEPGEREEAMRVCAKAGTLEAKALLAQLLIEHARLDEAEGVTKQMQAIEDDDTLTQLACATVAAAGGEGSPEEALTIYRELGDKYGQTPYLRNCSAACCLFLGRHEEAEKELQESLATDAREASTLALMVTASPHLNKSSARALSQLRSLHPEHPFLRRLDSLSDSFDRAVAAVSA